MSIVINSLAYIHADGENLFNNINFSISSGEKASLVGNNGVGKSTLLQIIAGNIQQTKGEIIVPEKPYYIPQNLGQFDDLPILEVLQVNEKINSLHAILKGDTSQENLDKLDDDWSIEERINTALRYWNLEYLNLSQKMGVLSGGEKLKIFLVGILIHFPNIILLDEPTNHLDSDSKSILYDFIQNSKSTILIVSHDRELLNYVNKTIDLSNSSIEIFGGNYDFYEQQKKLKIDSLYNQLTDKTKNLKQVQQKSRDIAEQRQKQDSRGKGQKIKAGIPRIAMGRLKNKAEQSTTKFNNQQVQKTDELSAEIHSIKNKIESILPLKINIKNSNLHRGKTLVEAKHINLSYAKTNLWENPLSFCIYSGDRILIKGNNGVGKTSLAKIITKDLQISVGDIFIDDFTHLYLDQEYSLINNNLTVLEQAKRYNNRGLFEYELKMLLHHHQLSQDYWNRECSFLSGGEKVKLLLCCLGINNSIPDVLILDEPTNNLDINSQDILTYAVKKFEGTILVISHDNHFVNEININKTINL